jgi:hypothetical protein
MSERTTGATPEQVEAAAIRGSGHTPETWRGTSDAYQDQEKTWWRGVAKHIVPPDYRILTPEDLAGLRRVVEYHRALNNVDQKLDDDRVEAGAQLAEWLLTWTTARDALTADDIDRLAALIGDDGNG